MTVVPTLQDNFSYLIQDLTSGTLASVDVNSDIKPLISNLKEASIWGSEKYSFAAILSTHKHYDHCGGNLSMAAEIKKAWPRAVEPLRVIGGGNDDISGATESVYGGDVLKIGNLEVRVVYVPCHTAGHVAYHIFHPDHEAEGSALFTGDTLFIGGLGAFFEGTSKEMCVAMERLAAVNKKSPELDEKTFVFPGHEYTAGFMKFSVSEYPDKNSADASFIAEQKKKYEILVRSGMPSVPSSLADEKKQNLFMRAVIDEEFRKKMNKGTEVKLMEYLYNACD